VTWKSARWLLVVLAVGVMVVLGIQRSILFPRDAAPPLPDGGRSVPGLERWALPIEGGEVEAYFLPGDGASAARPGPAALFAHGNAELIDYWTEELAPFRRMGISLLLVEYRGYGRSAGAPSQEAIAEDFLRFHDRLAARPEVDTSRLIYVGRSLGGGAVCDLARTHPPAAMILMSTFTSVADMARRHFFFPRFLVLDPFDNEGALRGLDVPVLLVHGRHDSLIDVENAHRNARAARRSELILYDADHNDCPPSWPAFFADAHAFLERAGILRDVSPTGAPAP